MQDNIKDGKKNSKFDTSMITTFAGTIGLPCIIFYSLTISNIELEKKVLTHSTVIKYLDGSKPKKVIIVTGKIINVVL